MPLLFTDEQVKELTGQLLATPDKLAAAEKVKTDNVKLKQDFKDLDDTNAVFTDYYRNIIAQYHTELKYLNGTLKTDPITANIEAAATFQPGNAHYPGATWSNYVPKISDDILGLPTSVFADTEVEASSRTTSLIALMKNGFSSSGFSTSVSATTATTFTTTSITGLSVGNTVVVYGAAGAAYGTVSAISTPPSPYTITMTVIYGNLATVGGGATASASDAGFTLAERNNGAVGNRNNWLLALRTLIDTAVLDFETRLNAELTALNLNDSKGEVAQITAAKNNITGILTSVDTWQAYPLTGASRHGTNLPTLETLLTTRSGQLSARITEITTALGSPVQAADGVVTGAGAYKTYYENVSLRINLTKGTLIGFYTADTGIRIAANQIALAQTEAARNSQAYAVRVFSNDANNSSAVKLKDVSGLSNGQSVKIMANDQPVINTTITGINDLEVSLGASIPNTYTAAQQARLVYAL
jgi:hypothetical protein